MMDFWTFVGIVIILIIIGDYFIDALKIYKGVKDE